MPSIVFDITNLIAWFLRLLGMAAIGVGFGYLAVDLLHKAVGWPMQAVGFLGLAGVVIAMAAFLSPAALGGFGIGLGAAIFIWGMPRQKKFDQE